MNLCARSFSDVWGGHWPHDWSVLSIAQVSGDAAENRGHTACPWGAGSHRVGDTG